MENTWIVMNYCYSFSEMSIRSQEFPESSDETHNTPIHPRVSGLLSFLRFHGVSDLGVEESQNRKLIIWESQSVVVSETLSLGSFRVLGVSESHSHKLYCAKFHSV